MTNEVNVTAKRNYKDSVFRQIFGEDKEALLSLYNALNGTNYDNPEDLIINTLESAIFLGKKMMFLLF